MQIDRSFFLNRNTGDAGSIDKDAGDGNRGRRDDTRDKDNGNVGRERVRDRHSLLINGGGLYGNGD